jgi:glycosyltransferase involved in cell wall biosynthesis
MLEAMSVGAPVIASRTSPVLEVIEHGRNGWLVDFFDPQALARQVVDVVTAAKDIEPVRQAARQTITDRFDLHTVCLPQQLEWTRHFLG